MTDDQLRAALGGLENSTLVRSLIWAEVTAIREGADRAPRTQRYGLWYQLVKPALSRAGLLDKPTRNGTAIPWEGLVSKYLAEMVREGRTSYEELHIADGSRQRQVAVAVTETMATVELVGAHFPWVILFTEKDTIWDVVENVATLYGVSAISGGGEPSNVCTDQTVKLILRSDAYREEKPGSLVVMSLTDFDPFGYCIAQAQFAQVREAASGVCDVKHTRLGLLPSQLTAEERQANAYKPKEAGLERWFAETGGVDGEPLGLELDALPLSRIRAMFAEGIEAHIDLEKRQADLRNAFVDLTAWELLKPEVTARLEAMRGAVQANGLWQEIQNTQIPGDLLRIVAEMGWDSINPTNMTYGGKPLFQCTDEVKDAMRGALAGFDID